MEANSRRPDAYALVHGAAWRAASLLSRVGFLALVVPRTVPGEFGIFFSYSSIGILLSRVVSVGAIDHLPTKIKGKPEAMHLAAMDLAPLVGAAAGFAGIAALTDSLIIAALALALCTASGLVLAGAVRSVSPSWFERWLNLQPAIFLAMALLLGSGITARDLLLCQSAAVLLSQLLLLRVAADKERVSRELGRRLWVRRVSQLLAGGQSRMLSDTLTSCCIRALAIGPILMGSGAISDSLALALALGEAIWTVGMILVHRNFAYYCSVGPHARHSLRSATILLLTIASAGVIGVAFLGVADSLPILQRLESKTLLAAFLFFAGVAALSELRYFDVATGKTLVPWVFGQIAFVILAAFSPGFMSELWAIWCVAAVTIVVTVWLIARRRLSLPVVAKVPK